MELEARALQAGRPLLRHAGEREHAARPQRGGAARPRRPGAPGRPGALDRRPDGPHAAVRGAGRPPVRAAARAGLGGRDDRRGRDAAPGRRRRGRRGAGRRAAGADRARARPGAGRADPRPAVPRGRRAVLALPGDPAQPDQLVRRGLHGGGRGERRSVVPAPRPARPGRTLRPRHPQAREAHRGQPAGRHALPVHPARLAEPGAEPRLARVREHGDLVHAPLGPRAAARHGEHPGGRPAPARPLGAARDRRLLDARGLPELGHGLRLPAPAPEQEDRPRAARAAGAGAGRRAVPRPRVVGVGQAPARRVVRALRALAAGGRRRARRAAVRRRRVADDRVARRARREPDRGQRRARDRRRARRAAERPPAAALRLRPGQRPPRGHDAALLDRDRPGQPGRVPVRRHRHRAPVRRPPGGRGEHRRGAAGVVRPDRAAARRPDRARHPAPAATGERRPAAAAPGAGPEGRRRQARRRARPPVRRRRSARSRRPASSGARA